MAVGKVNSLGVGSGVLSYDVIDKLREADEHAMIKPIDRKMEQNIEKQKTLTEIKTLLSDVRAPVKVLADYSTYLGRKTNVSSDAIKVNVVGGVPIQNVKVDVEELAQGDINELGGKFESRDSTFSETDVKLSFYTQGKNYNIEIKKGMKLEDVAQLITDETDGEVTGIIMKTGGAKPYQLMMNSKGTGESSRIYFGTLMQTDIIPNKDFDLQEGDLSITLKDKNGMDKTLNIIAKSSDSLDSTSVIKQAIRDAIANDLDLKDLLDSEINIGLDKDGKALIISDFRGESIKIGGEKASSLGFRQTESSLDSMGESGSFVKSGKINGTIVINGVSLDLSKMTNDKNTSQQNAEIIAQAINEIDDMSASSDADGRLKLHSKTGEINIQADDAESQQAVKDIGLQAKVLQGYAKLKDSLFKVRNIQKGSDSIISYNGTKVSRPGNKIDDVFTGISMELQSKTEPGKPVIISINRDVDAIVEQMRDFVKAYNELVAKLNESTRYDEDSKVAGIFNGVGDIRTIRTLLTSIIAESQTLPEGISSIVNYGITLNDKGIMFLDENKLRNAVTDDPQATEEFFFGRDRTDSFGREEHVDGIFIKIDKFFSSLVDGSNSRLGLFESSLERDARNLQKEKKSANDLLDTRYDVMAQRFAAYDSQIAKAKNAFGSVQMMIDQSVAKK